MYHEQCIPTEKQYKHIVEVYFPRKLILLKSIGFGSMSKYHYNENYNTIMGNAVVLLAVLYSTFLEISFSLPVCRMFESI